jgi:hypothetical protein
MAAEVQKLYTTTELKKQLAAYQQFVQAENLW